MSARGKTTGQICWREKLSVSDLESTRAQSAQFTSLQSHLTAHDQSLIELRGAGDERKNEITGLSAHQAVHAAGIAICSSGLTLKRTRRGHYV